jgi:Protein of unknown function (DUF2867)
MDTQAHTFVRARRPLYQSRLVRPVRFGRVAATAVPESRLLTHALPAVDHTDAYAVTFPYAPPGDPQEWADAIFRNGPPWVKALFGVRKLLVRLVGIEPGDRHVFDTVAWQPDEVLVGVDQSHLGFRASVLFEGRQVVLTTIVQVHNRRGRAYWALVRWIHPVVVRTMLARATRAMGR